MIGMLVASCEMSEGFGKPWRETHGRVGGDHLSVDGNPLAEVP